MARALTNVKGFAVKDVLQEPVAAKGIPLMQCSRERYAPETLQSN
jgi:hypothetical protein